MYRAVESFLREKSEIGCPWLVYNKCFCNLRRFDTHMDPHNSPRLTRKISQMCVSWISKKIFNWSFHFQAINDEVVKRCRVSKVIQACLNQKIEKNQQSGGRDETNYFRFLEFNGSSFTSESNHRINFNTLGGAAENDKNPQ
jgi:hypothetical protein